MKETYNFLQTYEICFKLIYLKLLQEYFNNKIVGFTDIDSNNTKSFYYTVTDIQGSITEVYDGSSKLVWKSGYTAFGELAGETVDLIDFDGMYTGCDYDAETGLTYHWNRWRSEDGSAFISEDPARDGMNWYGYCNGNPICYTDPEGKAINIVIGAIVGFVSSSATEIGGRMISGQRFSEAVKNTFTDKTSLAIIGSSTLIGAATSGVSGLAVNATTKGVTAAAKLGLKSGIQAVGEIAVKTVAINTVAGAVDAGTKDIVTHTIKGESQTFGELANTMLKGALSASLFSSFTQGTIFNGTTTSGQVGNLFTGTMANFNVNQPQWAGSVGVVGKNIIPTMIDIKNNLEGN